MNHPVLLTINLYPGWDSIVALFVAPKEETGRVIEREREREGRRDILVIIMMKTASLGHSRHRNTYILLGGMSVMVLLLHTSTWSLSFHDTSPVVSMPSALRPEEGMPLSYTQAKDIEQRLNRWSGAQVNEQVDHYSRRHQHYGNKADFDAWKYIFDDTVARSVASSSSSPNTILVVGVNKGLAIDSILDLFPANTVRIHGMEVLQNMYDYLLEHFQSRPEVKIHHRGASHRRDELPVTITGEEGSSGMSGLFKPEGRWADLKQTSYKVKTMTLTDLVRQEKLGSLLYVLIDVEGHEPNVIKGMQLEDNANRRLFPVFQFELGGTWADTRRDRNELDQFGMALYLESLGYQLYLMGATGLLRVSPEFFRMSVVNNEGHGTFVQGNLLAYHPSYAYPALGQAILARVLEA